MQSVTFQPPRMEEALHRQCVKLHERLTRHALAWPFLEPVDPVAMNLPTYFEIISHPMDLSTMFSKLTSHQYTTPEEYREDLVLMFENAMEFNKEDTHEDSVGEIAKRFMTYGLREWERAFSKDATTDWRHVTREQVETRLIDRAKDARMVQRWKRDSFVARLNREKKETRAMVHGETETTTMAY